MDRILRINMGGDKGPTYKTEPLGDYAGLGGRALTSAIISKEVPPLCHPLGEDNRLVFAPGMLSGTSAAMSGRLSVGCKSPLTGGIKESNAGGQAAQVLARLGYAAIVLEGKAKADTLYGVVINKEGVVMAPDDSLKMLGNYALVDKLRDAYGDKIACISIGQAGEMKLSAASVAITDMELRPTRHAGRGGVGAVMGAKGVKAIVLDDTGTGVRRPMHPERFKAANKAFVKGLREHPVTGQGLPAYGTNVLTKVINDAGAIPPIILPAAGLRGAPVSAGRTRPSSKPAAAETLPRAATGDALSVVPEPMSTGTATTSPNSRNMKPYGPMAATAALMIWMRLPGLTGWMMISVWIPLKWVSP